MTVSGSTITAFYNDATTNTGLSIVGHGCQYSTVSGGPSGGTSTKVTVVLALWTFQQNTQLFQSK